MKNNVDPLKLFQRLKGIPTLHLETLVHADEFLVHTVAIISYFWLPSITFIFIWWQNPSFLKRSYLRWSKWGWTHHFFQLSDTHVTSDWPKILGNSHAELLDNFSLSPPPPPPSCPHCESWPDNSFIPHYFKSCKDPILDDIIWITKASHDWKTSPSSSQLRQPVYLNWVSIIDNWKIPN